jgi:hypothetical protein
MANALYDLGRQGFLDGSIDWDTDDIRVALLTNGYTPNLVTHQFVSDLGANIVARSGALAGKTVALGVADADDVTFTGLTGSAVQYAAIFKHTGADGTARLIALLDTITGVPFTPSGSDWTLRWSSGATRIFKL